MVTDSRLVILCHNSGQEHFYQALNTGPWCLSELVCRQFRSTWMFLDGSPLKLNKHLTVTLLKCCYRNIILNVQIQMNHKLKFAHVSTLVSMIYGWRCQLRRIKATKGPDGTGSRLLKSCADQLCGIGQHMSNLILKQSKVPQLWKNILPGPCESLVYLFPAAVEFSIHLSDTPPHHPATPTSCSSSPIISIYKQP